MPWLARRAATAMPNAIRAMLMSNELRKPASHRNAGGKARRERVAGPDPILSRPLRPAHTQPGALPGLMHV